MGYFKKPALYIFSFKLNTYFKILLTLVISLLFISAFYLLIDKGQKKFHSHKYGRVREIFQDTARYDILFLGSSRTHGGIYPRIIDSVTGKKSYNGGVEGGNLYEFKLTLDGYLFHHPAPQLVVLNIDPPSFDLERKMFFPLQYFEELRNPALEQAFKSNKQFKFHIIRYVPFMRLMYFDDYSKSMALRGLMGSSELTQFGNAIEDNGFLSLGNSILDTSSSIPFQKSDLKIEQSGLNALSAIIDTCKSRNIRIVFGYAPEYNFTWEKSFNNFSVFLQTIDSFKRMHHIPFYRDDSLSICRDPKNFAGYAHVNTSGAIQYSRILGERLKYLLKE